MPKELPEDRLRNAREHVPLPTETDALVGRILDDLKRVGDSQSKQKAVLSNWIERAGVPKGLPTVVAAFDHPDLTPRQVAENRRQWVRQHQESIGLNLRQGHTPSFADDSKNAVVIPITPNIVTNRFAQRLLRDVLAPSTTRAMIAQYGATAESNYKFMAVNAMGVGTDSATAAVANKQLGAGASPANQWCWYHANNGATLGADLDNDLVLSQAYAVDAYAKDTTATVQSSFISSADAAMKLTHTDSAPDFEFMYEATWRFGTDGDDLSGNFGSDAAPDSWREIGLANAAQTVAAAQTTETLVHPDHTTHPNLVLHMATRKVFAGNGFAKTSTVKLSNQYTVRFTAG